MSDFKDISNEINPSELRPDDNGKFHYCYLIRSLEDGPHCEETGEPMKYFGVRSSDAIPHHDTKYYGSGKKIIEDIKTYGKYNFEKLVLSVHETRSEAMEYEEYFMDQYKCVDEPDFYNLSWKSTGGSFDYHKDLRDGTTTSPQIKNGAQKVVMTGTDAMQLEIEREKKKQEAAEKRKAISNVNKEKKKLLDEMQKQIAILEKQEEEERQAIEKAKKEAEELEKEKRKLEKEERRTNQQPGKTYDGEPDKRIAHKGQMGGARPGAGRPKGSRNIATKASVKKLEELAYDPIESMLENRARIEQLLAETRSISAQTSLVNSLHKIDETLIKYGYRPVPTREEKSIEVEKKGPMSIVLTGQDTEKTDDTKPVQH